MQFFCDIIMLSLFAYVLFDIGLYDLKKNLINQVIVLAIHFNFNLWTT